MSSGKLYGTDALGNNLIAINILTGTGTIIGNMGIGVSISSLAFDSTTDSMYAGTGMGVPTLYKVDLNTAAPTFIGRPDPATGILTFAGMAFDSSGILFASVNTIGATTGGGNALAMIDKNTGNAVIIGSFINSTSISGLSFDSSGNLWGIDSGTSNGRPALYMINKITGNATLVVPIIDQAGNIPSIRFSSLEISSDGKFYAGVASATSSGLDAGRLVEINPLTGIFQFIGTVSATTNGQGLSGLAFDQIFRGFDFKQFINVDLFS